MGLDRIQWYFIVFGSYL